MGALYSYIVSDKNIYHAIFSMESFIFEKTLLDEADLKMYHRLSDKFDFDTIGDYIEKCKERINEILLTSALFDVKVYFKPKSYDEEKDKFSFRPIHTASLMDQICMVCLLNPLMFNHSDQGRSFSELSKLIPHHFYGNIPSVKLNSIFEYWPLKYKEYNQTVVTRCREYVETHEYKTEICLDIQDFFPSISPFFIYEWVLNKLGVTYDAEEDKQTLQDVLIKLLFFHLDIDSGWEKYYYKDRLQKENVHDAVLMSRGIAQGLPQGLFFGNLCMIEIARVLELVFPGDSYFYVDDSVIFSKELFTDDSFKQRIKELNFKLETLFPSNIDFDDKVLHRTMSLQDINFLKGLSYVLTFHVDNKSFFANLEALTENENRLMMFHLSRQVSLVGSLSDHLDEVDDVQSLDKLNALIGYIDKILEKSKKRTQADDVFNSRIKFLKRHRKYFLFWRMYLGFRVSSSNIKEYVDSFRKTYSIQPNGDIQTFFSHLDEDIFRAEYRLLIMDCAFNETVKNTVLHSHQMILSHCGLDPKCMMDDMYFVKDLIAYPQFKMHRNIRYHSLSLLIKKYYWLQIGQSHEKSVDFIARFLAEKDTKNAFIQKTPYIQFVLEHSDEFKRMVLNALISEFLNINVDDGMTFHTLSPRGLRFHDVRILYYLRNRHFKFTDFEKFLSDIQQDSQQNKLNVLPQDSLLQMVAGLFVHHVKIPEKIDQLLVTHMLVKGLWMNGSKYLYAYTLHNEQHAVELIRLCIRILRTIDCISLKQEDYQVLFLACYLHDISMVIQPSLESFCKEGVHTDCLATELKMKIAEQPNIIDVPLSFWKEWMVSSFEKVYGYFENSIRERHPFDSMDFVKRNAFSYFKYLSTPLVRAVADVAESHGWDIVEVYGRRSQARTDLMSMKYMMILIRLADLLDMSKDRVNYFLLKENMRNLSPMSRFHWISHFITNRVELTAQYETSVEDIQSSIEETILINIYLNANYQVVAKTRDTECHWKAQRIDDKVPSSNFEFMHYPRIENVYDLNGESPCSQCYLMCKWMHRKHEWLFPELEVLERYINLINNSLFTSKIKVNIVFEKEDSIDQDLYDDVHAFLNADDN